MERISFKQVQNAERFFRVPKQFFESPDYKKMSADAKLLYAILRDRFELSVENNWIDSDGNIYFIFTIEEIANMIGCGKDKAIKLKKELKKYDLLEEVRQGLNRPNLIYLGSLQVKNTAKPLKTAEIGKSDFRNSENQKSRSRKNRTQEVGKSEGNDTDLNETEYSDTDFIWEEDEEKAHPKTSQKIDKATKYDKDYVYQLVLDQFITEGIPQATVDYLAMGNFDQRYQYALENMRYAPNAEAVASYVFTGLNSDFQLAMRRLE